MTAAFDHGFFGEVAPTYHFVFGIEVSEIF